MSVSPNTDDAPQNPPLDHGAGRRLRVASYDLAYRRFLQDAYAGFMADNELLGGIEIVNDRHVGPTRNVRSPQPLDQPTTSMSAGMTLERSACRATDVGAHDAMIQSFCAEMIGEQSKALLAHIGETAQAVGNVVSNVGEGAPTLEQWRELLRRVELDFDEDGRLKQQIVVHPSQAEKANAVWAQVKADPECVRIVTEKRLKWLEQRAARSRRTLSR